MTKTFSRGRGDESELHEAAQQRKSPTSAVVFEAIRHEGEEELRRGGTQLFWSAFAAGLAMGFSFLLEGLLAHELPKAEWTKIISAFGYSLGFFIVVLGRQQLYTENPLTAMLPLLNSPSLWYLFKVLRLWGVVLAANLVGTLLFASVLAKGSVVDASFHQQFRELSAEAFKLGFGTSLLRSIYAGWLIALMVWLLPFAETARWIVIVLLTYVIGLAGFPHVIAGAVEAFYGVFAGVATWEEFFSRFFLPALLGNTLGGVVLVAALNYGQVASGRDKEEA